MNSRYFFLIVMLLNLLLPVYGSDDTVQVNDTTNIEIEGLNHANESDETIYDPIQTPVYTGTTLFCSKIAYDVNETPCDAESRLVVYSSDVRDTIQGALRFIISFDIATAGANKELVVQDINDIEIFRCDNPELDADTFIPIFREALSGWHWWLGDYMNPLTMYPRQQWAMKYIIVPDSTSHRNKR